jgi:hypothetical protein
MEWEVALTLFVFVCVFEFVLCSETFQRVCVLLSGCHKFEVAWSSRSGDTVGLEDSCVSTLPEVLDLWSELV